MGSWLRVRFGYVTIRAIRAHMMLLDSLIIDLSLMLGLIRDKLLVPRQEISG